MRWSRQWKPMKYKFPYWGPLVLEMRVAQEFVDILLEKGKESRDKNLDSRKKLAGMLKHEYYYKNYEEWFGPRFNLYVNTYIDAVSDYRPAAFKSPPTSCILDALWINYQKANEYNPPHNHAADLSFVIYLQVPDEIKKEHEEMQGVHNNVGPGMIIFDYGQNLPFSINAFNKLPSVGDVFIFPAWLKHYVHAFKSDVERISVSGNVTFKYD